LATTTLEIDGVPISMPAANLWPARMRQGLRGLSALTLVRRGGALDVVDPYLGKPVVLKINGVVRFAGDIGERPVDFTELGWTRVYQCLDITSRADKIPFTDSNTKMDFATWNVDPENIFYLPTRAGRSVGQILKDILTMQENADALDAAGIGNYTSLSPPTLPAETVADLDAMTVVPPERVRAGGERLWTAIVSLVQAWAPNHAPRIAADGTIRFLDVRNVSELVLTLGDCDSRVMPSGLSRSVSECFQRVLVRGQSIAVPRLYTTALGGLVEQFAWGSFDNAGAKADWEPADFLQDQAARSQGTMSVTDLTHVVLTSTPTTDTWGTDEWGPANRRGVLYAWYSAGSGINQGFSTPVVANTAKSSGGTSTFTLERPLPATNYNRYVLYGISSGASLVWRKYKVADPTAAAALGRQFTSPAIYVASTGSAASQTSYPVGSVCWSTTGNPPYNETPNPIVSINPVDGTVLFYAPTYNLAGGPPADVRALLPVYETPLTATKPATGYAGTSHDVEGLENTLVVTADSWRDPANQVNVEAYAQDLLDSVKDAIVEGSVTIQELYEAAFDFGVGVSIEAVGYDTGWEGANVPVTEIDVTWNSGAASHHTTTLSVSNRRASYSLAAYMQPERRPEDGTLGLVDFGMMGGGMSPYGAMDYGGSGFDSGGLSRAVDQAVSGLDSLLQNDFAPTTGMTAPTSARDPRSPRDDTPAGERPYKPAGRSPVDRVGPVQPRNPGNADAVKRQGEANAAARAKQGEAVKAEGKRKAEARNQEAARVREGGRAKATANEFRKSSEATQAQRTREDAAARQRAEIDRRNAEKKARDAADGGQDWRDAP